MRHKFRRYCLLSLVFSVAIASAKDREWQTGKLVDANRNQYFAGTVGGGGYQNTNANGSSGTFNANQTAVYRVSETYVIEGDTYAYVVEEQLKWRWSKPANVMVNAQVRFAVNKRKLWILDEDGKEHETRIVKRILRAVPAAEVTK